MQHPTYTDALGMTKAQIFEYIVENSPDTHVAKSWNREHLLNAFANAFPAEAVETAEVAEESADEDAADTVTMTFGAVITEFLIDSGFFAESISPADRGRFTFDLAHGRTIEAALSNSQTDEVHKPIRRNLALAQERVAVRLDEIEDLS